MSFLPYMYVYVLCAYWVHTEARSGFLELESWTIVKLLYVCWELNLGPLQEQQVLLTAESHLSNTLTFFF